jgi:hypothetical protein
MIYTSPIDSITWQALDDFLAQGLKEGTTLDYKIDWPNELEKTIAAMANTLGGVILVGVGEETDTRPKCPPVGVPFIRGLAEKITNIVLSNITPPVFPDVAVCPDPAQGRAIIVIRVPQSHQTPHAIMGNRRVYVRTGNVSTPEELATVGEIEWLREHRALSEARRDSAYRTAIDRSDLFLGYVSRMSTGRYFNPVTRPYVMLCAAPYYPTKPLVSPPDLKPIVRDVRVPDYFGTDREFPPMGGQVRLLQDGVYLFANLKNDSGERAYYAEFNTFGQLFYRQTLLYELDGKPQIRAAEIIARLDMFGRIAKKYLEKVGHQGLVWFNVLLGSVAGSSLLPWNLGEPQASVGPCEDGAISFEQSFSMADWDAQSEDVVVQATQKIGWAYNWEATPQLVRRYIAGKGR